MKTIDMTLTWQETARMIVVLIENGTPEGRGFALKELQRMALLADMYVASMKPPEPLGAVENIGSVKDD